jgi:hypothetical protein
MYSKTSTAILGSLAAIAVEMLFATGPIVVSEAYAYGYHHYYHHHHSSPTTAVRATTISTTITIATSTSTSTSASSENAKQEMVLTQPFIFHVRFVTALIGVLSSLHNVFLVVSNLQSNRKLMT